MAEKPGTPRQARAEEKALQLAVTCIRQRSSGMTALTPWICLYISVDWGSLVLRICRVSFLGWWFLVGSLLGSQQTLGFPDR